MPPLDQAAPSQGAGPAPPGAAPPSNSTAPGSAPPQDPSNTPGAGGEGIDEGLLEEFMDKAYVIIYGGPTPEGEANDQVVTALRSQPSNDDPGGPVETLATTAATLSTRVSQSAKDESVQIGGDVVFAGTMALVGELAGIAEQEGVYEYSQDEIDRAGPMAAEQLGLMSQQGEGGMFDRAEMESDLSEMEADDQSGQLEAELQEAAAMDAADSGGAGAGAGAPLMGGAPA